MPSSRKTELAPSDEVCGLRPECQSGATRTTFIAPFAGGSHMPAQRHRGLELIAGGEPRERYAALAARDSSCPLNQQSQLRRAFRMHTLLLSIEQLNESQNEQESAEYQVARYVASQASNENPQE
jgi:hypothetical protein